MSAAASRVPWSVRDADHPRHVASRQDGNIVPVAVFGRAEDAVFAIDAVNEVAGLRLQNETMAAVGAARERQFETSRSLRDELATALRELIAIRDAVAEAGGMDGPLAQETIDAFARRQIPAIDVARAALARFDAHMKADVEKVAKLGGAS